MQPSLQHFHAFRHDISGISLPERFTYPFHYTPHPLCLLAAQEVQEYIAGQNQWKEELERGKMFGVLIVSTTDNQIGYICAFSGNLAGSNHHEFFVPPIYDLLQPNGFFKEEEANISNINHQIIGIQNDEEYLFLLKERTTAETAYQKELTLGKERLRTAKEEREKRRAENPGEEELARMVKESQFQKAELKRQEKKWTTLINGIEEKIGLFEKQMERLKKERKSRSAALQQRLFDQFQMLNAKGENSGLCSLFKTTPQQTPPAGAGECAAPKMLQYAYQHKLSPIAMAEFWWGNSPKAEIRHHGQFYPACKSKCEPILNHMLVGLSVDGNPMAIDHHKDTEIEIVYEDKWLLAVNKPAGMLSAPGKLDIDSVYDRMKKQFPEATGPLIVHRLDMATSGLLLIAKSKEIHKILQSLFKNRKIKKRYIAILDGSVKSNNGTICLPLCADINDRPRQMVNLEYGKAAVTEYQVLERGKNTTRILFLPQTGRTHQLRVHASHPNGLNCPILGDELYGKKADRLYLHAEYLEFQHPKTGKTIKIEKRADF